MSKSMSTLEMAQECARTIVDSLETKSGAFIEAVEAGLATMNAWSLLSIAESLDRIADAGIETYELDADGHRRYR